MVEIKTSIDMERDVMNGMNEFERAWNMANELRAEIEVIKTYDKHEDAGFHMLATSPNSVSMMSDISDICYNIEAIVENRHGSPEIIEPMKEETKELISKAKYKSNLLASFLEKCKDFIDQRITLRLLHLEAFLNADPNTLNAAIFAEVAAEEPISEEESVTEEKPTIEKSVAEVEEIPAEAVEIVEEVPAEIIEEVTEEISEEIIEEETKEIVAEPISEEPVTVIEEIPVQVMEDVPQKEPIVVEEIPVQIVEEEAPKKPVARVEKIPIRVSPRISAERRILDAIKSELAVLDMGNPLELIYESELSRSEIAKQRVLDTQNAFRNLCVSVTNLIEAKERGEDVPATLHDEIEKNSRALYLLWRVLRTCKAKNPERLPAIHDAIDNLEKYLPQMK